MCILFFAGTFLFMMIVGEEAPDSNLTAFQFWFIKFGAFAGMYLLYRICKLCYKAGLFPEHIYEELKDIEDETV